MNRRKVIYKDGDNEKYDYYLLAEKEETALNANSLAFKFDTTSEDSATIQFAGISGNADLVLSMETKDGIQKAFIFCNYRAIKEI